jgi:hypothetical protein
VELYTPLSLDTDLHKQTVYKTDFLYKHMHRTEKQTLLKATVPIEVVSKILEILLTVVKRRNGSRFYNNMELLRCWRMTTSRTRICVNELTRNSVYGTCLWRGYRRSLLYPKRSCARSPNMGSNQTYSNRRAKTEKFARTW